MLKKILTTAIVSILLSNCSGNRKSQFEGFNGNILIIHVSEFIPENAQTTAETAAKLENMLNRRASIILACYVSLHINRSNISSSNDILLNSLIHSTVSRGHMFEYIFDEKDYCDAYAEYNLTDFFAQLESVNK